jgi:CRP-like cAMP-binding protein
VEVSWRATGLLTESSISIIVPNTHLMARPFRNFSHPDPWYRESLRITLPLEVSAEQAERNLLAAAWSLDLEGEPPFPPSTRIRGFTERGVDWELRFFVPNAAQASTLRSQVHRALLHNLRMAGLGLPSDSLILHAPLATGTERTGRQALGSFLRGVELFDGLTDAELERVAADADHHPVPAGQTVMRQGEEGASLFILREGLLRVSICDAEGLETDVGEILPGHFFGEMSLLTGDHRSATVRAQTDSRICEITRESLQPLLQERPDLVRQLSETLADRQMRNAPKLNRIGPPDLLSGDVSRHSLVKSLFLRISAAFRLVEAP